MRVIVALAICGIVGCGSQSAARWEYRITSHDDVILDNELDVLGRDGWELVSARRASDGSEMGYECIYKRPTKSKAASKEYREAIDEYRRLVAKEKEIAGMAKQLSDSDPSRAEDALRKSMEFAIANEPRKQEQLAKIEAAAKEN